MIRFNGERILLVEIKNEEETFLRRFFSNKAAATLGHYVSNLFVEN
jgi:hypothetical protein